MNKVTTINLNGNAYQLEEDGYDALREYLDSASRRLEGNPDRDEIMADIEQAIADKFRTVLGAHKTVVATREVEKIIREMGPVEDISQAAGERSDSSTAEATAAGATKDSGDGAGTAAPGTVKRLYRVYDGAIISGVCNGLAAYLNIDVLVVRIVFVVLTFLTSGAGLLVYLLMALFVPSATTSAEKSAAYGTPFTAQEFIRRAKEGYYEGMKTFKDKRAHREWKRRFKHQMRNWGADFQRQMREDSHHWRQNWNRHWSEYGAPIDAGIALPVVSLLRALVAFLGVFAMISLFTTGAVFGLALPAGVPVWVGAILVFIAYQILAAPLRAIRHAYYHQGGYGSRCGMASMYFLDSMIWLGALVVLIWVANRYVPQAHEALQHVTPVLQRAWDSVREWWSPR